jgi:hypothetical protein
MLGGSAAQSGIGHALLRRAAVPASDLGVAGPEIGFKQHTSFLQALGNYVSLVPELPHNLILPR